MNEWISVKERIPDPEKEEGWYVVLINRKVHVCYFCFVNWDRPWNLPSEWQNPTHYIKLPSLDDFWSNKRSMATMD